MDYIPEAVLGLIGSMTLVQLAPIKIDPWTWLARKIGHAINGDVIARLDKLEATFEERAAKDARIRILRFGDEILHGVHHSKEHFDQILQDITEYDQYCDTHKEFKNNMTVLTTKHIMETYSECLEEHKFWGVEIGRREGVHNGIAEKETCKFAEH